MTQSTIELELAVNFERAGACKLWTGYTTEWGYGLFWDGSRHLVAHVAAFEVANGPVPAGLVVDHTCHNADPTCRAGNACSHRRCIEPTHLRAITRGANTLAGRNAGARNAVATHCVNGHAFDAENTYIVPARGIRMCRACRAARMRAYRSN